MAKSIRIPLAEPLTNRDSTASKDSKLTNCYMQQVAGQPVVVKRPGTLAALSNTPGYGGGTFCYNGENFTTVGNSLIETGPVLQIPTTLTGSLSGEGTSIAVSGNYAYIINISPSNFIVVDITNPAAPIQKFSSSTLATNPSSIVISGSYAYVADAGGNAINVIDISNPLSPTLVSTMATPANPRFVYINGGYLYVVNASYGANTLSIYTFSATLVLVGSILIGGAASTPHAVVVSGAYAYVVTDGDSSLYIYNISVPATPTLVSNTSLGGTLYGISLSGSYVYIVNNGLSTLDVFDISNPASPLLVSSTPTADMGVSISLRGVYVFIPTPATNRVVVYNIATPSAPFLAYTMPTSASPVFLVTSGIYVYTTGSGFLLNIFSGYYFLISNTIYPIIGGSPYYFSPLGGSSSYIVVFKTNVAMYTLNTKSKIITKVTSPNYPATTIPGLVYLDGTFYVATADSKIWGSAIEDPTTWSALNYTSAEIEPDGLVAISKSLNYLVAFGQWTTEFFYDAGNATGSPLSSVPNAFFTVGCASGTSVVRMENEVVWMSQTIQRGRQIMALSGFAPSVISTPEVDRILNADDLATVYSFSIKISGSVFYVLTLKTSAKTLVYDFSTKQWHFWTSMTPQAAKSVTTITSSAGVATVTQASHGYADGDLITIAGANQAAYNGSFNITYVDANTYTYPVPLGTVSPATGTITSIGYIESYFNAVAYSVCSGSDLIQGESDGIVYKIDPSYYNDNGNYINTKIKTVRIDGGESKRKFVSKAEIIGDKVVATGLLRHTDDDYVTYSVYRPIDMNAKRSMLLRGGHTRRRAYEFRCTASVPLRLGALELDMEMGTS